MFDSTALFFRSRLSPSVTANTRFLEEDVVLSGCHVPARVSIKTESIKKLSNFHFHWTKNLVTEYFEPYRILSFFYAFHAGAIYIISYL